MSPTSASCAFLVPLARHFRTGSCAMSLRPPTAVTRMDVNPKPNILPHVLFIPSSHAESISIQQLPLKPAQVALPLLVPQRSRLTKAFRPRTPVRLPSPEQHGRNQILRGEGYRNNTIPAKYEILPHKCGKHGPQLRTRGSVAGKAPIQHPSYQGK